MKTDSTTISAAFGAARDYHDRATVQRTIARNLAHRMEQAAPALPPLSTQGPRIVEIGCGTGFLSHHLKTLFPTGRLLLTDITPQMITRCRTHMEKISSSTHGEDHGLLPQYAVMDGEYPSLGEPAEIIAASMVFQWFENLPDALARLAKALTPGGSIFFATPGCDTFKEWRALCARENLPCAVPHWPTAADMQNMTPRGYRLKVDEERLPDAHPSRRAFLRELKAVGAHRSRRETPPISTRDMRRLLNPKGCPQPFTVTYHILYGHLTAKAR